MISFLKVYAGCPQLGLHAPEIFMGGCNNWMCIDCLMQLFQDSTHIYIYIYIYIYIHIYIYIYGHKKRILEYQELIIIISATPVPHFQRRDVVGLQLLPNSHFFEGARDVAAPQLPGLVLPPWQAALALALAHGALCGS